MFISNPVITFPLGKSIFTFYVGEDQALCFRKYTASSNQWDEEIKLLHDFAGQYCCCLEGRDYIHLVTKDGGGTLLYRHWDGTEWTEPAALPVPEAGDCTAFRLAASASGLHLVSLCAAEDGAQMLYWQMAGTETWAEPAVMSLAGTPFEVGNMVVTPDGSLHLTASEREGRSAVLRHYIFYQHNNKTHFHSQAVSQHPEALPFSPYIASDKKGNLHLAWLNADRQVCCNTFRAGWPNSGWQQSVVLSTAQSQPPALLAGHEHIIALWQEKHDETFYYRVSSDWGKQWGEVDSETDMEKLLTTVFNETGIKLPNGFATGDPGLLRLIANRAYLPLSEEVTDIPVNDTAFPAAADPAAQTAAIGAAAGIPAQPAEEDSFVKVSAEIETLKQQMNSLVSRLEAAVSTYLRNEERTVGSRIKDLETAVNNRLKTVETAADSRIRDIEAAVGLVKKTLEDRATMIGNQEKEIAHLKKLITAQPHPNRDLSKHNEEIRQIYRTLEDIKKQNSQEANRSQAKLRSVKGELDKLKEQINQQKSKLSSLQATLAAPSSSKSILSRIKSGIKR